MNIRTKSFTLTSMMLSSVISFAGEAEFIATILALKDFFTYAAFFIGLALCISAIQKMITNSQNQNQAYGTASISVIIITFICSGLLMNSSGSIEMISQSVLGGGYGFCEVPESDIISMSNSASGCWDLSSAEIFSDAEKKKMGIGDGGNDWKLMAGEYLEYIVLFFQLVGFIFFLKGVYAIQKASEKKDGMPSAIFGTILSAAIVNLPLLIEIIQENIDNLMR